MVLILYTKLGVTGMNAKTDIMMSWLSCRYGSLTHTCVALSSGPESCTTAVRHSAKAHVFCKNGPVSHCAQAGQATFYGICFVYSQAASVLWTAKPHLWDLFCVQGVAAFGIVCGLGRALWFCYSPETASGASPGPKMVLGLCMLLEQPEGFCVILGWPLHMFSRWLDWQICNTC